MDTTKFEHYMTDQASWMASKAHELGYETVQALLFGNMDKFIELGSIWRKEHDDECVH